MKIRQKDLDRKNNELATIVSWKQSEETKINQWSYEGYQKKVVGREIIEIIR